MKNLLPLLLLLYSLLAWAEEQVPPQVDSELVTLALDEAVTDLYWFDGAKVQPFRSVPRGLGIPAAYRGPAELVLHRDPAAFLPDAPATAPVVRIPLPMNAERILILTAQDGDKGLQGKAIALEASQDEAGGYLIHNLSRRNIALSLGDQTVQVDSGASGRLSDPVWKEQVLDLPVYMGYLVDGELKTYCSVWGHRPVRRNLLFVVDSSEPNGPLKLRRTYDLPPEKEVPAE